MNKGIKVTPKDKSLLVKKGVKCFLEMINADLNRECTPDKLADIAFGYPYKAEIINGKARLTVIKDFYEPTRLKEKETK